MKSFYLKKISISEILKQIREDKDLSQIDITRLAGTHPSQYNKLEKGLINPGLDIIQKILEAVGYEIIIQEKQNEGIDPESNFEKSE